MSTSLNVSVPAGAALKLELRSDGSLLARRGDESRLVWLRQSFPWTESSRFLSLRDADDEEFAMVDSADHLDPDSRRALEGALVVAGFVLELTRVLDIDEEVEVRHWTAETVQGQRSFQTRLDEWPRQLPRGGLLIRDVAGDLYYLADREKLDRQSQRLLWSFVD
ncbi:MAG TPA: DUF1854 domain-containing protein [Gemmatimonadales bacterium]|jgi:hypothetical protein